MKAHCKKCSINWADLWGDSDCEYCPKCSESFFLEEFEDGEDGHIRDMITGRIVNVRTGEQLKKNNMPFISITDASRRLKQAETAEKREAREEAALDAYHKAFHINPESAQEIYHQTISKQ